LNDRPGDQKPGLFLFMVNSATRRVLCTRISYAIVVHSTRRVAHSAPKQKQNLVPRFVEPITVPDRGIAGFLSKRGARRGIFRNPLQKICDEPAFFARVTPIFC